MSRRQRKITGIRPVDEHNQVVSLEVEPGGSFCRYRVCDECPWRRSNTGSFPPGAFVASAPTAYDAAFNAFACHMSGVDHSLVCAGFLLRNSVHNLGVRMAAATGRFDPGELVDPGEGVLHGSYREMAVANGVDPDDPALEQCREDDHLMRNPFRKAPRTVIPVDGPAPDYSEAAQDARRRFEATREAQLDLEAARKLIEEAFFLRQYGERPPGADPRRTEAETWRDWERRAEVWLRGQPVQPSIFVAPTDPEPPRWRGLTDPVAIRRQTLHDAWLAIHARRFEGQGRPIGRGGPDSTYHGVQIAEHELRDLWAETGDEREIGSLSNWEAPGDGVTDEERRRRAEMLAAIDAADEDD